MTKSPGTYPDYFPIELRRNLRDNIFLVRYPEASKKETRDAKKNG